MLSHRCNSESARLSFPDRQQGMGMGMGMGRKGISMVVGPVGGLSPLAMDVNRGWGQDIGGAFRGSRCNGCHRRDRGEGYILKAKGHRR